MPLQQHLQKNDVLAQPYSLMIITDHLLKCPINKEVAKQVIYPYGFVNSKFRINSLKRVRDAM